MAAKNAKNAKKFAPRASSALTVEVEEDTEKGVNVTPISEGEEENSTPLVSPEGDDNNAPENTTPNEGVNEGEEEENSTPPVAPPDNGITFTGTTNSKPVERRVKVRLAKKFDACIGGEWYHLKKDEVAIVPENVKRILSRAEGMLKPL